MDKTRSLNLLFNMGASSGMELALQSIKQAGPRGGNLEDKQQSQHRREPLNAERTADGMLKLHSAPEQEWRDTALNGRKNEQPWHRMAAFMLLQGRTNSEIAMAAKVTVSSVTTLRAQRWFHELLAVLANEQGQDIQGLMASEAAASVQTLVAMRDDEELPARVRADAAKFLIEQTVGKPTQKIVTARSSSAAASDLQAEMEALQAEIRSLEEAKKKL